jgi:hypothetical protein
MELLHSTDFLWLDQMSVYDSRLCFLRKARINLRESIMYFLSFSSNGLCRMVLALSSAFTDRCLFIYIYVVIS